MNSPARLDAPAPAALTVELRCGARRVFRLSRSLGARAVRLEQPAPLPPDSPVELSFALPLPGPGARQPVCARGRLVVLGEPSEADGEAGALGIALDALPERDARALADYVATRLGGPAPG